MNFITKSVILFTIATATFIPTLGLFDNSTENAAQAHSKISKKFHKHHKTGKLSNKAKRNYRASGRTCGRVSFYSPERNAMGGWSGVGSAASKTLPFGTRLNVRTQGGRTYNVVINDRGPYIAGRDLDIVSNNPYRNGVQNACW